MVDSRPWTLDPAKHRGRPEIDQDAPGRHHLLMPESKLLDERSVRLQVTSLEIRQQAAPGTHHLEQAAAAVMVLQMGTEVVGEGVDPLGQERHLHLSRPGVGGMRLVLCYHCLLIEAHATGPLNDCLAVVIRCSTGK